MSIASDQTWHTSKAMSWGTILGFAGLIIAQVIIYGDGKVEDGKAIEKMATIEKIIKEASATHIRKTEVDQRIITQEFKIQAIAEDVKETKVTMKENQKMIIELLQRIPKRPD